MSQCTTKPIIRLVRPVNDQIPCTVSSTAPGYPKRDKRGPLSYLVDVQADLSLYCHTDLIVGFVVLAQILFLKKSSVSHTCT